MALRADQSDGFVPKVAGQRIAKLPSNCLKLTRNCSDYGTASDPISRYGVVILPEVPLRGTGAGVSTKSSENCNG